MLIGFVIGVAITVIGVWIVEYIKRQNAIRRTEDFFKYLNESSEVERIQIDEDSVLYKNKNCKIEVMTNETQNDSREL